MTLGVRSGGVCGLPKADMSKVEMVALTGVETASVREAHTLTASSSSRTTYADTSRPTLAPTMTAEGGEHIVKTQYFQSSPGDIPLASMMVTVAMDRIPPPVFERVSVNCSFPSIDRSLLVLMVTGTVVLKSMF